MNCSALTIPNVVAITSWSDTEMIHCRGTLLLTRTRPHSNISGCEFLITNYYCCQSKLLIIRKWNTARGKTAKLVTNLLILFIVHTKYKTDRSVSLSRMAVLRGEGNRCGFAGDNWKIYQSGWRRSGLPCGVPHCTRPELWIRVRAIEGPPRQGSCCVRGQAMSFPIEDVVVDTAWCVDKVFAIMYRKCSKYVLCNTRLAFH